MDNDLRVQAAPDYAAVVLGNLSEPYPHSAHHTQVSADDRPTPEQIHPAFYTSFDWHSCVHMHWLGTSLLGAASGSPSSGAAPEGASDGGTAAWVDGPTAASLREALGANLTPAKLAVERDYLLANPSWERPYGWAWLMRLAATCSASSDAQIREWGSALEPLVDAVAELSVAWMAKAQYPVRHGLHTNAAFGVGYMLDAFRSLGREDAATACEEAARGWFADDRGWPGDWELSGQDFLSAGLSEADLMRRVLSADEFAGWFAGFLPELSTASRILQPVSVTDETDGYLVHLHGLNLTRAGQVARIIAALRESSKPEASAAAAVLSEALDPLLKAGLSGLESGDFMSTHWLASFAWDALGSVAALD
ncbi:hypothetical protein DFO47_1069 [Arthrobacter sp. AG258]|uniref:DUF2891 family protein n=1 Tax=Arthrobacter sp. AG258 TaxID=2183899 RepID=UPI00105DB420|nr:DUF2891 family protein [Arthrobacter sp. AG258]TDT78616.1 hypothetical protein DFO47_1069 [Arthrobacter sp. AG258]